MRGTMVELHLRLDAYLGFPPRQKETTTHNRIYYTHNNLQHEKR